MSLVAAGLVPKSLLAATPAEQDLVIEETAKKFSLNDLSESIRQRHKEADYVNPEAVELLKDARLNKWVSVQHQTYHPDLPIPEYMLVFWLQFKYGPKTVEPTSIPEISIRVEQQRVEFDLDGMPPKERLAHSLEFIVLGKMLDSLPVLDGQDLAAHANAIHRETLRSPANFIVAPEGVTLPRVKGITQYASEYMPKDEILMGYKGGNYLETGAALAVGKMTEEDIHYVVEILEPTYFRRIKWTHQ